MSRCPLQSVIGHAPHPSPHLLAGIPFVGVGRRHPDRGGLAAVALGRLDPWVGIAVAFVVCHFFLFCNVLRMSRPPELVWAGVFMALAVVAVVTGALSWPVVLASSAALTVALAVRESHRPSYHGVGWRRLNPQLPAWWSTHLGGEA